MMRVLLVGDGTGQPPEVEGDPVPAALASLPGVSVERVRLVADAAEASDEGPVPALTAGQVAERTADVWVTGSTGALTALGRAARARDTRLVHRARGVVGEATPEAATLHAALGLADAVVVPSQDAADWLRRGLGALAPELVVVPPWLAGPPRPRATGSSSLFLAAGPLRVDRRPMLVVRSFARAAERLPAWRLRLLGGGPSRGDLRAQADADGLGDRLSISGPGPAVGEEWAAASVGVVAGRVDPFPVDALAAMAAGVPVLAFDVPGGVRELVSHGRNGLLVVPGSAADLAAAMHLIGSDADLRDRLGRGALATAAEHAERHGEAEGLRRWAAVLQGQPVTDAAPARQVTPVTGHVDRPGPTPAAARAAAMDVLVAAARRTGAPWFVLRRPSPTVVLPTSARDDLLAALADLDAPSYLSLRVPEQTVWGERRWALAQARSAVVGGPVSLVVEPWPTDDSGRASVVGQGCDVAVRFWHTALDGDLVAPRGADVDGVRLPVRTVERTVAGRPVPVLADAPPLGVDELGSEVDVVVTWVDGADQGWDDARRERLGAMGQLSETSAGRARFADHGELRYALRSVHHFAPWVRRVHLVTAGQRPAWLAHDDDRVRVVDHREILPPEALPTFSSRAIETRLHHVEGLAEHFVYLNDDVLLGRPQEPTDFFTPGGLPRVFLSPNPIGTPGPDRPAYLAAAANNRRLLQEEFGVQIAHTLAHTPHPHRRSTLLEVEERYATDVSATTLSPFRSDNDVSMLSSLAQHHGLLTGRAVAAEPSLTYVSLGSVDLPRQLAGALRREQDVVCVGDDHSYALDGGRVDELLAGFLEDYLPHPAPWETDRR